MKFLGLVLGLSWLIGSQVSLADDQQGDVAAIQQLLIDWKAAIEAEDVEGYVALLDADAEILPAHAPPIRGLQSCDSFLRESFREHNYDVDVAHPEASDIEVSGDLAIARYAGNVHHAVEGSQDGRIATERKFLDVLRRQEDGSWRLLKHMWNYDHEVDEDHQLSHAR